MKRRKATPAEPTYPIHGLRILEPEKPAPRAELFDQDADVLTDDEFCGTFPIGSQQLPDRGVACYIEAVDIDHVRPRYNLRLEKIPVEVPW